ncbi:hypothetical protein B0H34DRAFT_266135 [Crassisporium funariophilum]|nr:hypothetical protein B0H34DRAFT_266135 [Crassisporium funariophilum]
MTTNPRSARHNTERPGHTYHYKLQHQHLSRRHTSMYEPTPKILSNCITILDALAPNLGVSGSGSSLQSSPHRSHLHHVNSNTEWTKPLVKNSGDTCRVQFVPTQCKTFSTKHSSPSRSTTPSMILDSRLETDQCCFSPALKSFMDLGPTSHPGLSPLQSISTCVAVSPKGKDRPPPLNLKDSSHRIPSLQAGFLELEQPLSSRQRTITAESTSIPLSALTPEVVRKTRNAKPFNLCRRRGSLSLLTFTGARSATPHSPKSTVRAKNDVGPLSELPWKNSPTSPSLSFDVYKQGDFLPEIVLLSPINIAGFDCSDSPPRLSLRPSFQLAINDGALDSSSDNENTPPLSAANLPRQSHPLFYSGHMPHFPAQHALSFDVTFSFPTTSKVHSPPGTPGVKRQERQQGWSGEWNQAHIQDVIQKLRAL